jgi:hypothetical protein
VSNLIVNANAPVDTVTITIDNRMNPPDIKFSSNRPLPVFWVVKVMTFCISGLMDMALRGPVDANAVPSTNPNTPAS